MIESFEWGFLLGILGIIVIIWGFLLVYIPIFYLYNRFVDKNAIYAEGFLKYYFLGSVIVCIVFECYIALYVPFDYRYPEESNAIYYPIQQKYAEYNENFAFFVPTYLIGTPIALDLTQVINKLHQTNKTSQILHRGKTIIFGIFAPSGLFLIVFVTEKIISFIHYMNG
ncbi:hypothetical protein [Helicobacter trogontum]|uniref:Uncharacterized protein n=1 Tax=Helicobacter trogontum TaxID=50960 RepID=A0A4U8S2B2_9HELI|nr:hypothetical protein [Helicobacter trogontum]TLD79781.1 hypothetical protein LS81_010115 [Helicobacter trogontum]